MAGYSGTPLVKKLGVKEGFKIHAINAPADYRLLLAPLPAAVQFTSAANNSTNLVHVFATKRMRRDFPCTLMEPAYSMRRRP